MGSPGTRGILDGWGLGRPLPTFNFPFESGGAGLELENANRRDTLDGFIFVQKFDPNIDGFFLMPLRIDFWMDCDGILIPKLYWESIKHRSKKASKNDAKKKGTQDGHKVAIRDPGASRNLGGKG